MKKIDLHTHTTASDGIKSPLELIDFARDNDLIAMVIADHDTVDGLPEAIDHARDMELDFIPGIEFSLESENGTFHLVSFWIDHNNRPLQDCVNRLAELRSTRAKRIVQDLNIHNINISYDEVLETANGGVIGKPHIARVLVKHGYSPSVKDVFKMYLEEGKPGHVKKEKVSLEEAVRLTLNAGGIPIVAHPGSLEYNDFDDFEDMLRGFIDKGVMGIEAYAEMHSPEEVAEFSRLADKYDLLVSGGSDFHGDKEERIGYYSDSDIIPVELYYNIKEFYHKNR